MKSSAFYIACSLLGTLLTFGCRQQATNEIQSPFPMFTAETDETVATTIPIDPNSRIILMGKRSQDGNVIVTSISYTHDGQSIMLHDDTERDGVLDELQFRTPPFEQVQVFGRQNDGTYVKASKERHRAVEEISRIYDEVFGRVFSGDLSKEEADRAVHEAHQRVKELSK